MTSKSTQFRAPAKACVYCGKPAGRTKDHVPPKSIFLDPLPRQLVTVPACESCNSGFSCLDTSFKEWLGFSIGVKNDQQKRYWNEKLLPTVRNNRRRHEEIISSIHQAGGLSVRAAPVPLYQLMIDASIQERMMARLVRGLWYREHKKIVPPDLPISQMLLSDFQGYESLLSRCRWKHFDDQFSYGFGLVPEYEWTACWCFLFHGANATIVLTGRAASLIDD